VTEGEDVEFIAETVVELEVVEEEITDDVEGTAELVVLGGAIELDVLGGELLKLEEVDDGTADDVEDDVELIELELDDDGVEGQLSSSSMVLVSSVIDAPRANTPPKTEDSAFKLTETAARMFPTNSDANPRVALVPTFQYTLPDDPPVITTDDPIEVVKVLPI
jgi:hypothetical protein